jgi:hypothetical protein
MERHLERHLERSLDSHLLIVGQQQSYLDLEHNFEYSGEDA